MKVVQQHKPSVTASSTMILPRSIGVMIAAFAALLCWLALIAAVRAFG